MAEALCDPFPPCEGLDGQLLINRTLEGPPLATADGEIPFQSMAVTGSTALPYLRFRFRQTWKTGVACMGPVRSVLGLAPEEEITFDTRTAVQYDFGSVITNTDEYTSTFDSSYRDTTETTETTTTSQSQSSTDTDSLDLGPLGSWGCGGDADVNVIEEVVERTQTSLRDILVSASQSHTNSKSVEVTSSTQVLTENSITRRVRNPYYDRSLELRFSPIFREFDVQTVFDGFDYGIVFRPGVVRFPAAVVATHGDLLERSLKDRNLLNVAMAEVSGGAELATRMAVRREDPVSLHLGANPEYYTAAFLHQVHTEAGREPLKGLAQQAFAAMPNLARKPGAESGLAFDQLKLKGDRVLVPARSLDRFKAAVRLPRWQNDIFDAVEDKAVLKRFRDRFKFNQTVHLFMGTHVEPVAGQCVLADVPAPIGSPET